jgi:hypothetical protein
LERAGRSRARPRTAPGSPVHAETGLEARTPAKGTSRMPDGLSAPGSRIAARVSRNRQHFSSKDAPWRAPARTGRCCCWQQEHDRGRGRHLVAVLLPQAGTHPQHAARRKTHPLLPRMVNS